MNEELYKKPKQLRIISFMILPLVLCLVVVGKLACPCNPQSCAGGSLVLLAGSTMPDWSAEEGSVPRKVYNWVNLESVKDTVDSQLRDQKAGFRKKKILHGSKPS